MPAGIALGLALLEMAAAPEGHNFGRGECGCAAGDWRAGLAKLVCTEERNLGNFLSLSKTGLKQAVLLTDTDIFTFLGTLITLAVAAPRLSWPRLVHFVI